MSGELWLSTMQVGKEVTPGTGVASTRRLYTREPRLTRERPPRYHKFATRTRTNVRAVTNGPVTAGGSFTMPMSADEIIESFLMGIQGAVTPTVAAGVSTWNFTAGGVTDLDSVTYEWHDGAQAWRGLGYRANQIRIAGSPNGENIVTTDLFGNDVQVLGGGITAALAERDVRFIEGWETQMYMDAFGGTPGTTVVPATLLNWDITINNNLGRKYAANNVNAQTGTTSGELAVEARLTVEAAQGFTITEFNNWNSTPTTKRLMRLVFGNNELIAAATNYQIQLDMPGAWGMFDLAQSDAGTRAYGLTYSYVYDSVNAFAFRAIVKNARATAY